jgi:hypothetical protein
MIDAEHLQEFLAKVLFGDRWKEYKKFVVHRQGNLENAQQKYNSSAFFTFYVQAYTKETLNAHIEDEHIANITLKLNLQGIGTNAEQMMLTTLFWDERSDVREELNKLNCILLESPRMIVGSPYFQDGANTILAYDTVFKISCTLTEKDKEELMPDIILGGVLHTPSN